MNGRDFVHRGFGGAARQGDVAAGVLLPVTRQEVLALAATWADARQVADHYGWLVWTGRSGGLPITACSTGMGSASAAIAIEELALLGARTLLGIGSTRAAIDAGPRWPLLVAEGAMRLDAASHGYARAGFPAAPDPEVVMAAVAAGRAAGAEVRHDVVADIDAELDALVGAAGLRSTRSLEAEGRIREAGAVPVSGSPATLFVQGAIHGLRTGYIAASPGDGPDPRLLASAAATLATLAAWDAGDEGGPLSIAARMAVMPPTGTGPR